MGPDGCRTLLSDESRLLAGIAVCAVLTAVRMFYGFCEAADDESGYDIKGLGAAFAAHRALNSLIIGCIFADSFAKPLFIGTGSGRVWLAAVITAAAACIAVSVISFLCRELPQRIMKGEKAAAFCSFTHGAAKLLAVLTAPAAVPASALASLFIKETEDDAVTEEEILMMVDAGNETGAIESSEREMINNVFEFHELAVSEVMTHRTDIVGVSIDAEISEAVYTAINSGFSRIPVYKDSIDHIEGIIYVKDLLCLIGTQSSEGVTVRSFLRDAEFVPESSMCDDLFRMFTEKKQQMAVAVDEYGGTAGIVTMEDLVESIVGSIQDEYDNETDDISKISEDTFTIRGNADPSDVMEVLGETLPEDSDYDTMSGFITDLLGRIPEDGETPSVTFGNTVFTVLITEDMRIVKIKAKVQDKSNTVEKEITENE